MLRDHLSTLVSSAIDALITSGKLPEAVRDVRVEIIDTKQPEHGDFACNFAMMATKKAGMNPRALGELLREALLSTETAGGEDMVEEGDPNAVDRFDPFNEIEIAGPGFINFRLNPTFIASYVAPILGNGSPLSSSDQVRQRINVEFVSVNPNGPITVGSGRGAAFGDTLCRVLAAAGNEISREYYINDGVNSEQMRQFADSVRAYVENTPFPEKGYRGEYVQDVAAQVTQIHPQAQGSDLTWYQGVSQSLMIERQKGDLAQFGVKYNTWFSEQSLHDQGKVEELIAQMIASGVADEHPYRNKVEFNKDGSIKTAVREEQPVEDEDEHGASATDAKGKTLWLRSTKFGDDMDRVLRRMDGRLTYIASDVAYHADKFNRPADADKLITILGPDHHGYIGRLHAVLAAQIKTATNAEPKPDGLTPEEQLVYTSLAEKEACLNALAESRQKLQVVIYQLVRFLKDGQPAPMRKRDGNIYELRDLINELGESAASTEPKEEQTRIGRDVARFFYLTRSHDTSMDFDIDLATKQSDENPVFYAQYAHARISSVIRKAEDAGFAFSATAKTELLTHERESALIKKCLDLPWEVQRCAEDFGVHRLTTYAVELGRTFHHFYDACRVIQPEAPELTSARLALCEVTRLALKSTFDLLGVSAPDRMDRAPQ